MTRGPQPIFIIGAQRSGTTFLRDTLLSSPEVKGTLVSTPEPRILEKISANPLQDWRTTFFGIEPEDQSVKYLLEKSTSHLDSVELAQVVIDCCPDAKVLVVLRDPISRAISHYRFSVDNGIETLSMEEAFHLDASGKKRHWPAEISVNPFFYLRRGRYADYLKPWWDTIPKQNLYVDTFEALVEDSAGIIKISDFLGISGVAGRLRSERVNTSVTKISEDAVERMRVQYQGFFKDSIDELVLQGIDVSLWNTAEPS